MRAYSMDLRERALLDSDAGMKAADVATKYRVSGSWVRLLKQRRRDTGEVAPRVQRHGRRCMLEPHLHTLAALIAAHPDRTLAELKDALATPASVPTVWRAGGRIWAGVQGGCAVGGHRDRRRGRTRGESGGHRGGGDPCPDRSGGLERLPLRARVVADAERRGGAAARRRRRRARRRPGCRRRPGRVGHVDRAGGGRAGADAAGASGRRVL